MIFNTIYQLLKHQAEAEPDAIALLAPNREPLTYHALFLQVEYVVKRLNRLGIVRNDRVAIVLPNGPEMVTAFLGVASGATSAPLNPGYRKDDFEFYLSDLGAKALITQSDLDTTARDVAKALDIPIIELSRNMQDAAGLFYLEEEREDSDLLIEIAMPGDVALVLHTSGTTSRPKIVPLTHKNLCTSAFNIRETLYLTKQDRCLNVMPLFHIHGLMAVILSSLSATASIVCTPGFDSDDFFNWLLTFQPTWYTAVPTMHQSILSKVDENQDIVAKNCLRFIRSSSASLPPLVMKKLEEIFHAPVIEAYGMTEASHQMASNPLPPRQRKPGTVGVAAGPEVRIMDEAGNFLPPGQIGEIVIKGDNVTSGYEKNSSANETAFTNGWFRTGDLGELDTEGYLSITGRLKEMVNRGGEKIAPREVDEALLDHPNIVQTVAFAVPHPTLGEDLVAAVVLREGTNTTERELREFTFSKLADFKVPSKIVIVEEIPKGPTGKIQRIGLAEKLETKLKSTYISPTNSLEEALVKIWENELGIPQVGIHDNFFSLGGDSLSAVAVMLSIEDLLGKELEPSTLFRAPTIDQLASFIQDNFSNSDSYLVPLQPSGTRNPFFLVPGHGGDVFTFVELTRHMHPEQPIYVFRFPEPAMQDDDIANAMLKDLAASYIKEMRKLQPVGPYQIGGFCFGGELAFEMAQQLIRLGQKASLVVIIYAYLHGSIHLTGFRRISHHLNEFIERKPKDKISYLKNTINNIIEKGSHKLFPSITRPLVKERNNPTYFPMYYPGKITLFRPLETEEGIYYDPKMGWEGLAADIDNYDIPGDKYSIFKSPNVEIFADYLIGCLENSTQ